MEPAHDKHIPVLAEEALAALAIDPDGMYLDATFGRGGHSELIVSKLSKNGSLLAIDRDPSAIAAAERRFGDDARVYIGHAAFADLGDILAEHVPGAKLNGVLFDLGVSSPQLDDPERGFSFRADGPLDMRMDTTQGESAADWLERVEPYELRRVLREFGEERRAGAVAAAIVAAREQQPILTTAALADIVLTVIRPRPGQIHPATRTFQAIRIAVNSELEQIATALEASVAHLAPAGRLAVISFHSLEDRLVKRFMRQAASVPEPYRGLPDIPVEYQPRLQLVGKMIRAAEPELARNPRSRSARLRIAEKVAA